MNLILAADAAKVLNRELIDDQVESAQFYLRAKEDCYFFGLNGFLNEYLSKPITYSDLDEAKTVLSARGQRSESIVRGWETIIRECDGYLPLSIRAVEEGSFVKGGEVLLTVECYRKDMIWLLYHIDSLILKSIWYPTTMLTKMLGIREVLDDWSNITGGQEPKIVYDITGRACPGNSCETAAASVKLAFPDFDSLSADLYLNRNYLKSIAFSPERYLLEHNIITTWEDEKDYFKYLNKVPNNSEIVCLIDTYNLWSCFSLLVCDEIKQLAAEKNLTLFICPDSSESFTETLDVVGQMIEKYGEMNDDGYKVLPPQYRVVQMGVTQDMVGRLSVRARKMGYGIDNFAFGFEDSVLQSGMSRNTLGFEFKLCAVRKDGFWFGKGKDPVHKPHQRTLNGLQFMTNEKTKFLNGNLIDQNSYISVIKNLSESGLRSFTLTTL
ncbi:nicotinamide phosphoribosyltransferase domain-containing protein [Vibrio owensii]|uniref:nicotinamide phosphoribosyltransferase domain-containing protein n=1 Tax=Vibrio owensii TaxID=696485 RepID=UPI00339A84C1